MLVTEYEITYYDCCALAAIDSTNLTGQEIHAAFMQGGIEKATDRLLELEKEEFSVKAIMKYLRFLVYALFLSSNSILIWFLCITNGLGTVVLPSAIRF